SKVRSFIDKYYGTIPSQSLPTKQEFKEPEQKGQRNATLIKSVQGPMFSVAFRTTAAGEDETYAFDLLANILGEGSSSRLYKKLVYGQQLATHVSAYSVTPKDPGYFAVVGAVKPGQD